MRPHQVRVRLWYPSPLSPRAHQHCSAGGGALGGLASAADDLMRGDDPGSSASSRLLPSCHASTG